MKPLARGYSHQVAFYLALAASALLIAKSNGMRALISNIIYSLSLIGLYGISALYHCRMWSRPKYLLMKNIDHVAIFVLIAGTATPICLIGLNSKIGLTLISVLWFIAAIGMMTTIFRIHEPKWVRAVIYIGMGWLAVPYFPEFKSSLGMENTWLLLSGGILYTIGALFYAFKWPDFFPRVFGYHEVFHLFVVIASGLHFKVIYNLTT
jgi:hemolysin III